MLAIKKATVRQVQCKEVQVLTPTSDTERSSEQSWVSRDSTGVLFFFVGKVRDDMGRGLGESERCHMRVGIWKAKMVLGITRNMKTIAQDPKKKMNCQAVIIL